MASPFLPLTSDPLDSLRLMDGGAADVARDALVNAPEAGENPLDTERRQITQAKVQSAVQRDVNRMRGADLMQRKIPTFQDETGQVQPVTDKFGAPVTNYDKGKNVGFDSKGNPVQVQYGASGAPAVEDAFTNVPITTDPKTGHQYRQRPGLPWQWVGQSDTPEMAKKRELEKNAAVIAASAALGRPLTMEERELKRGEKDRDHKIEDLANVVPELATNDPATKKWSLTEEDPEKARALIEREFNKKFAENSQKASGIMGSSWFGKQDDPLIVAERAAIQSQKEQALAKLADLDAHTQELKARRAHVEGIRSTKSAIDQERAKIAVERARAAGVNIPQQGEGASIDAHNVDQAGATPAPATNLPPEAKVSTDPSAPPVAVAPASSQAGDILKRVPAGIAEASADTAAGFLKFADDALKEITRPVVLKGKPFNPINAAKYQQLQEQLNDLRDENARMTEGGGNPGPDPRERVIHSAMQELEAAPQKPTTLGDATQFMRDVSARSQSDYGVDPKRNDQFISKVASGIGSIVPALASGPGAPVTIAGMMAEGGRKDAEAHNATPEQEQTAFYASAAIGAVSEALLGMPQVLKAAQAAGVPVGTLKQMAGRVAWQMFTGSIREGTQEGLEQVAQNLIASEISGYDPNREVTEGVAQAAAVGAAIGGPVAGGITAGEMAANAAQNPPAPPPGPAPVPPTGTTTPPPSGTGTTTPPPGPGPAPTGRTSTPPPTGASTGTTPPPSGSPPPAGAAAPPPSGTGAAAAPPPQPRGPATPRTFVHETEFSSFMDNAAKSGDAENAAQAWGKGNARDKKWFVRWLKKVNAGTDESAKDFATSILRGNRDNAAHDTFVEQLRAERAKAAAGSGAPPNAAGSGAGSAGGSGTGGNPKPQSTRGGKPRGTPAGSSATGGVAPEPNTPPPSTPDAGATGAQGAAPQAESPSGETPKPAGAAPQEPSPEPTGVDHDAQTAATSVENELPQPTEAQKKAGNYPKGHVKVGGLDIAIENPAGSTRSGADKDGKPWSITMSDHYGYVKRTQGADGDQVDVFVKNGTATDYNGPVYVIEQVDPKTSDFDEHKAIIGATSEADAVGIYNRHHADDWMGRGPATTFKTVEDFKKWVRSDEPRKSASKSKPSADKGAAPASGSTAEPPESGAEGAKIGDNIDDLRKSHGISQGIGLSNTSGTATARLKNGQKVTVDLATRKVTKVEPPESGSGPGTDILNAINSAKAVQAEFLATRGLTIESARELPETEQKALQSDFTEWLVKKEKPEKPAPGILDRYQTTGDNARLYVKTKEGWFATDESGQPEGEVYDGLRGQLLDEKAAKQKKANAPSGNKPTASDNPAKTGGHPEVDTSTKTNEHPPTSPPSGKEPAEADKPAAASGRPAAEPGGDRVGTTPQRSGPDETVRPKVHPRDLAASIHKDSGAKWRERRPDERYTLAAATNVADAEALYDFEMLEKWAAEIARRGGDAEAYKEATIREEDAHVRGIRATRDAGEEFGGIQSRIWDTAPQPVKQALFKAYADIQNDIHAGAEIEVRLYEIESGHRITEYFNPERRKAAIELEQALIAWQLPPWLVSHLTAMKAVGSAAAAAEPPASEIDKLRDQLSELQAEYDYEIKEGTEPPSLAGLKTRIGLLRSKIKELEKKPAAEPAPAPHPTGGKQQPPGAKKPPAAKPKLTKAEQDVIDAAGDLFGVSNPLFVDYMQGQAKELKRHADRLKMSVSEMATRKPELFRKITERWASEHSLPDSDRKELLGASNPTRRGRIAELEEANRQLKAKEITREQYDAMVQALKPVAPLKALPEVPTDAQITEALMSDKQPFVGAARTLPAGTKVGLRIDIPAFKKSGKYVVTIHEGATPSSVGKRIGYDGVAIIRNPRFFVTSQNLSQKIATGEVPKAPLATVEGEFVPSRTIPEATIGWTQASYDPERHGYFYDRETGQPVTGGEYAVAVGNTVFVKNATFGGKADYLYASNPQATRLESAYQTVQARDPHGFPDITISDLMAEAGITDVAEGHQLLRDLHKQGRIQTATGDWSLSDEQTRKWGIKLRPSDTDPDLLIHFRPSRMGASNPEPRNYDTPIPPEKMGAMIPVIVKLASEADTPEKFAASLHRMSKASEKARNAPNFAQSLWFFAKGGGAQGPDRPDWKSIFEKIEAPAAPEPNDESATPAEQVAQWVKGKIEAREEFKTTELLEQIKTAFGHDIASGRITGGIKHAYDLVELGVNLWIRDKKISLTGRPVFDPSEIDPLKVRANINVLTDMISRLPTQTNRTDEQNEYQQFSTPPPFAYIAAWAANLRPEDIGAETSAGVAGLAVFMHTGGIKMIVVNELSARRAALLEHFGFDRVMTEDASQIRSVWPKDLERPTVIVINPAFSATAGMREGERNTMNGAKQIEEALRLLEPGGRLVAIVGEGMKMVGGDGDNVRVGGRGETTGAAFKDWWNKIQRDYNVRANIGVSGENYRKYGTTFDNQILVIDKSGQTPMNGVITGRVEKVEELIKLLEGIRNDRPIVTSGTGDQGPRPAPQPPTPPSGAGGGVSGGAGGASGSGRPGGRIPGGTGGGGKKPVRRPGGKPPAGIPEPDAGGTGSADAAGAESSTLDPSEVPVITEPTEESLRAGQMSGDAVFASYRPQRISVEGAKDHPTPLVESSAMAAVKPPRPDYTPQIPMRLLSSGELSLPQFEVAVNAGSAHSHLLPNGQRKGYFNGDGTGTGKTREGIGIIIDNWNRGRNKGVWISEKPGLHRGIRSDMDAMDQQHIPIHLLSATNKGTGRITHKEGILYGTYKTMSLDVNSGGVPPTWAVGATVEYKPLNEGGDANRKEGQWIVKKVKRSARGSFEVQMQPAIAPAEKQPNEVADVLMLKSVKPAEVSQRTRVEQIVDWFGPAYDGVIILDESHNAQNSVTVQGARGETSASLTGMAVVMLQEMLPNARVVYMSATGATEVYNLAYADRLGLWGHGTAFAEKTHFINAISAAGTSAMELIAQNMKALGVYNARTLSFGPADPTNPEDKGVEMDVLEHKFTPDQIQTYDALARAWQTAYLAFRNALAASGGNQNARARGQMRSAFFSAQQRFFNQVLTAMQMPSVLKAIREDLAKGDAILIQLTNTNEALQERALAKNAEEDKPLEELDMTPKDVLMGLIADNFPIYAWDLITDANGNTTAVPRLDSEGNHVIDPDREAERDQLLESLSDLNVPNNPLEMILDEFGSENVAEITGRSKRVVKKKNPNTGKIETVLEKNRTEKTRAMEAQEYQDDKRQILIFSDAGGTGFSYHSGKNFINQRRRKHYTVQAGWRADKCIQGNGRGHRAFQRIPPYLRLCRTDMEGHKRFISTIARRLSQLGAVTAGDRRTQTQGMFSEYDNLENDYARAALRSLVLNALRGNVPGFGREFWEDSLGFENLIKSDGTVNEQKLPTIERFLNRLLMLEKAQGDDLFNEFMTRMVSIIDNAKANNTYDDGLQTLTFAPGGHIKVLSDDLVYEHPGIDAGTRIVQVEHAEPAEYETWTGATEIRGLNQKPRYLQNLQSGKVYVAHKMQTTDTDDQGRVTNRIARVGISGTTYAAEKDIRTTPETEVLAVDETMQKEGKPTLTYVGSRSNAATHYQPRLFVREENGTERTYLENSNRVWHTEADDAKAILRDYGVIPIEHKNLAPKAGNYKELTKVEAETMFDKELADADPLKRTRMAFGVGLVLPIWDRLQLSQYRLMRFTPEGHRTMIGVRLPNSELAAIRNRLGVDGGDISPEEAYDQTLADGKEFKLVNGWKVVRRRIQGNPRVEVLGPRFSDRNEWTGHIGGILEKVGGHMDRFFLPGDRELGVAAMTRLLAKAPIQQDPAQQDQDDSTLGASNPLLRAAVAPFKLAADVADAVETQVSRFVNAATNATVGTAGRALTGAILNSPAGPAVQASIDAVQRQALPYGKMHEEAAAHFREALTAKAWGKLQAYESGKVLAMSGDSQVMGFAIDKRDATPDNRKNMTKVLMGELPASVLPHSLANAVPFIRKVIDDYGELAVQGGLMRRETYERNVGKYLAILYAPNELKKNGFRGFLARHRLNLDRFKPRLSDAFAIVHDPSGKPVNIDTGDTTPGPFRFDNAQQRDDYLHDLIQRRANEMAADLGVPVTPEILAKIADRYTRNNPMNEAQYEAAGRIYDAAYPVAKTILQLSHDAALADLFQKIRLDPRWIRSTEEEGFTRLPHNRRYGTLSGRYVQEDIARELQLLVEMPSAGWALYDAAMSMWKWGKTVGNPATHGRNVIGNFGFATLAGNNPLNPANAEYYLEAISALRGHSTTTRLEELYKRGVVGGDYSTNELQGIMNSIAQGIPTPGMDDGRFLKLLKGVKNIAEAAYQAEDDVFKVAAYIRLKAYGFTQEQAANETRQWFPYYDNVPNSGFVRVMKRGPSPFFSFYYESIRIGANAARRKPLTLAALLAIPALITIASAIHLGLDRKSLEAVLRAMKGMQVGGLPMFSAMMPWKDNNGNPVQWDLTNTIPYADILGQRVERGKEEQTAWEKFFLRIATGNPLGNLVIGLGTNLDQFTGKPLRQKQMTTGETIASQSKFAARIITPPLTPFVGTAYNTLTAPQKTKGSLQKRSQPQAVTRALVGVDLRNASPSIHDMVEEYRSRHKLSAGVFPSDTVPVTRAKQALYDALINDDAKEIQSQMRALTALGAPLSNVKKAREFIADRHPLGRLATKERPRFMGELSDIERKTVRDNLTEFDQILRTGPTKLINAR